MGAGLNETGTNCYSDQEIDARFFAFAFVQGMLIITNKTKNKTLVAQKRD